MANIIPFDSTKNLPSFLKKVDIAALNNSFGFGGHNVALTFKSA